MGEWNITGTWRGQYAYDFNESLSVQPPKVSFTFTARQGWFGRFKGTVRDDLGGNAHDAVAWGRLRGMRIGFFKQYTIAYVFDRDKSLTIREYLQKQCRLEIRHEIEAEPIYYEGVFDPIEQRASGTWRIPTHTRHIRGRPRSLTLTMPGATGTWGMTLTDGE